MNTNEVCKNLNITLKSLIVYEDYGIVVPKREQNNYRNYSEDDLFKLRTVILLKELGFSLKDIRNLTDKNNYANSEFTRSLYLQLKAVERKICELDNVKNSLIASIDKMLESKIELDYSHYIGCGTGNLCGELSGEMDIIGIDQSLEMILQAKKKYNNMKFKLGNFLDKPFRKNDIDIVATTFAFHSLNENEKKEAIQYMLEYLKDDGKIIIADFMFSDEIERQKCKSDLYAKDRQDLWEVIDNKYYTNLNELQRYISLLGYKIHSQHIVNFTWIVEINKQYQMLNYSIYSII